MVITYGEKQCRYPSCGYHPDYNSSCMKARNSYGGCCGPCEGPCYIVACMTAFSGGSDSQMTRNCDIKR